MGSHRSFGKDNREEKSSFISFFQNLLKLQ